MTRHHVSVFAAALGAAFAVFPIERAHAGTDTRAAHTSAGIERNAQDDVRLQAVMTFAENVLEKGRDVYGAYSTPLFVDGINVDTGEPVQWLFEGDTWIISNMANQQNLFRTLTGLTHLTGDPKYKDAAKAAIAHMIAHHRSECGLLYWGGHQFVDLKSKKNVGRFDANCHEFKNNFPFYELMFEVDPQATADFIEAFWRAHILDWSRLDMNRHGAYGKTGATPWDHAFSQPPPFFEGDGLTFINAGSDLIYAGGMYYHLAGHEKALTWALRLAEQYVRARHPDTKLGVGQYSQPRRRAEPPDDPSAPNFTNSIFGDRAQRQFGPEFGAIALEGNILTGNPEIYSTNAIIQLQLAEKLGDQGKQLLEWTREGLHAYAKHAYDPETNLLRPMWADGTDLTDFVIPRSGYYGKEGAVIKPSPAGSLMLFSYALGYRLTEDMLLWNTARGIARGHGLGDLGEKPGVDVAADFSTDNADAVALFAVIELYRHTGHADYLRLARRIGDNILAARFHKGFFLPSERHVNAKFDAIEPLALLTLEAALRGEYDSVPAFNGGRGYIHGRFDGLGRTYDSVAIWSATR